MRLGINGKWHDCTLCFSYAAPLNVKDLFFLKGKDYRRDCTIGSDYAVSRVEHWQTSLVVNNITLVKQTSISTHSSRGIWFCLRAGLSEYIIKSECH
jgi:hypothetical protein